MVVARLRFRLCAECRRRFLEKYWRKDVSLALEAACRDFSDCPHFLLESTARVLRWRGLGSSHEEQHMKKQRRATQQMQVRIMPLQEQCCCFQSLPKDVLVQVLSYLPLRDLITSRLVSKAWSAAASDPLLLPLCLQNGPPDDFQRPWLLLSHHDRFAALHPSSHRWLWCPFLFKVVDRIPAPWHSGCFLSAASNGLFCLLHQHCRNPRDGLLIGNPFTGRWRFVSPHPKLQGDEDSFLLVMSADPTTGAYTLFFLVLHLVGKGRVPSYTPLLYDSTTLTWHEWPPIFTTTKYFNVNSMVCNGVLVACAFEKIGLSVLQYDLHNHDWREGWTRMPDLFWPDWHFIGDVGHPRLPTPVICQGRVFVAAKTLFETTSGGDRLKEECRLGRLPVVMHDPICIFELHRRDPFKLELETDEPVERYLRDPLKLELVTDVPIELLEELVVDSLGTDFILTTDADGNEIWLMLEGTPGTLVYDLALQEWSLQGPGCPAEEIMDPRHRTTVYSSLMWPCSI